MSQIAVLVIKYRELDKIHYMNSETRANHLFKELETQVKDGQIMIATGTVVIKDAKGNVKLRKTSEWTSRSGAKWGAFWGLLVGLLFAGPLIGLLGGLGLGAFLGDKTYKGLDPEFMKKLGETMDPGDAALFLLISANHQATLKHLTDYGLPFYTTELAIDLESALLKAADDSKIATIAEKAKETESPVPERIWHSQYDPGVPYHIQIPDVCLHQFLKNSVLKYPRNPAIIFFDSVITYQELDQLSDQFAAALQKDGFEKGDRISIYMPNLPQYTIAYYGALKAGGVVVPTNPLYVPREIEHQIKDSGATYMVVMSLLYNRLRQVRDGLGLKKVIVTNIKEYFPFFTQMLFTWLSENVPDRNNEVHRVDISEEPDTIWFQDFLDSAGRLAEHVDITPSDTAILMYTGGTTGISKGAELTHRNLVANVEQIRAWVGDQVTEGQCTIMTALPLSHAYSMTTSQNTAIRLGGAQVMIPNPRDMKDVLKNLQKHKVDFFPAVPTLYTAINHHSDVQAGKYDLSSIKVCISGGAGLPQEVQDAFMQITGGKLVEGYGLSECSPVSSANPFGSGGKIGTIGIPFPSTDYKIVDIETGQKDLSQGEEGELCIKGPQVMKGYWKMPGETQIALRPDGNGDLWLYTGDIAKMDADGYFKIMDRKKDIIIAGGFNIYPNEVEDVLYTHPDIMEAAVVGVPHQTRGEVAKAFVVLKEGSSMTEGELRTWCKKEMRAYMVPKYVEFRETLPKTMVGKILRRALVEDQQAKA